MDVRIRRAERDQPGFEIVDLESLVVDDHPVRAVWSYVEGLDLGPLYDRIKARGETPGRPATDPQILLSLWLYATIDGIGAARALDRLCVHHSIYRWICGGVSVNHTLLSEFRAENGGYLDQLLTSSLAALMAEGLVTLDEVITDGTKVRAAASRSSMRSLELGRNCRRGQRNELGHCGSILCRRRRRPRPSVGCRARRIARAASRRRWRSVL